MVQWLGLQASTAGDMGLIPGQGTKIPHSVQCGQEKKIFFFLIEGLFIETAILTSATEQSDTLTFFFHTPLHYGLSQDIEHSFLHDTVGPGCLLSHIYWLASANPTLSILLFSTHLS